MSVDITVAEIARRKDEIWEAFSQHCDFHLMKATVFALSSSYFIFSLGYLRYYDVYRCESVRCRSLLFFLSFYLSRFSFCINIWYHIFQDETWSCFAVWGRSVGDVPHRKSEALLHCHEEARQEKATESDQEAHEPSVGHVLRPLKFQEVRSFINPSWICTRIFLFSFNMPVEIEFALILFIFFPFVVIC